MNTQRTLSLLKMTNDEINNEMEMASAILNTADNATLVSVILDLVSGAMVTMVDEDAPVMALQAAIYRAAAGMVVLEQSRMATVARQGATQTSVK
jgi:hypothetical protein